jgi:hypothetical protein
VAAGVELVRGPRHRVGVGDLELDARLRHGVRGGPLVGSEARLGRLAQWPDAEMPAAGDLLAVEVLIALRMLQRKADGVDVETAAGPGIRGDHRDARDELHLHGSSFR